MFSYTENRLTGKPAPPKLPTEDTHDKVNMTQGDNNTLAGDNPKSLKEDPFGKNQLSNNDDLTGTDNSAFEPPGIAAKVTEL